MGFVCTKYQFICRRQLDWLSVSFLESSENCAYFWDQHPFSATWNVCMRVKQWQLSFLCVCVCVWWIQLNQIKRCVYNNFPAVTIHFDRYHIANADLKLTDKILLATNESNLLKSIYSFCWLEYSHCTKWSCESAQHDFIEWPSSQ